MNEGRKEGNPVLVIDAGDFSPFYNGQGVVKFDFLLESFRKMGYDAIALSRREMLMQREKHDAINKLISSGIPLTRINLSYSAKKMAENPLIITRDGVRVGVFTVLLKSSFSREAPGPPRSSYHHKMPM
jgi:hypothetical protein